MSRFVFVLTIGLIGTAILVGLGLWQVQRLQWKTGILAEIDARIGAAPVALPAQPDPEADKYLPVTVSGTFTKDALYVLTSRPGAGAGYRVIQGFAADGRQIMVDRGFIPADQKDAARPLLTATIIGNLHWPEEVDGFTPDPDLGQALWFARDVGPMADALGTEPTLVIQRDPLSSDMSVTPLPLDTGGIPNNHLQYAITWFSLAAVWVGMSVYFLRRTRRPEQEA